MIKKINSRDKSGNSHIQILYPGKHLHAHDTGIATIGRIDQAKIPAGTVIAMHPHVNDEILSYFRSGRVKHTDSEGFSEFITPSRLMLMKAGKSFYHEEKILDEGGELEGLQIFIRPGEQDLEPEVQFHELSAIHSDDQWRLLAAPTSEAPLQLRSRTWIYDMRTIMGRIYSLPEIPKEFTALLYVFQGEISVGSQFSLAKGESAVIQDEGIEFSASESAELVLFLTDMDSTYYGGGMYSGNQLRL